MLRLIYTSCFVFLFNALPLFAIHQLDSNQVFENWAAELERIKQEVRTAHLLLVQDLERQLSEINQHLNSTTDDDVNARYQLWIRKMEVKEALQSQQAAYDLDITKLRYKKGIELLRLLYEKILGLEHHFGSLQTFQDVASLSNPNRYPDFQQAKDWLAGQGKKKPAVQLPEMLDSNPYLSSSVYLIKLLMGGSEATKKASGVNDVACIMDFTVRMNDDLNTIYYETEFLKENNQGLLEECKALFADYTKVVKYMVPLETCRQEDDWHALFQLLDDLMEEIDQDLKSGAQTTAYNKQINLEFAVDRLLEFINIYNSFIKQGEKYYQKFHIILDNYPNEATCLGELPPTYLQMKEKSGRIHH